jgi:hypothetical protein
MQDDLALPLGMSFAAILAQVRSISTCSQGSSDVRARIFSFISIRSCYRRGVTTHRREAHGELLKSITFLVVVTDTQQCRVK